MKDFGKVESTVRPEPIERKGEFIQVATNIEVVEKEDFEGFSYNLKQYTIDEYIMHKLDEDKLQTNVALAELAIMVAGGGV